ncbi:FecR family protein [Chondrinema litorale]|uniref:FecR family protein n=1 Tax=Chondrinema litorale TaxID=2994555 RepID=UPI002542DAAA|nr:FecR family protein [Chondrinema litorale]UZR98472.1 FecR domain-containing protein [Chondrinema litorale]
MKKYEEFKLEDFLKDDFFMSWLKEGSTEKTHFWNNWIERNPEKVGTIQRAIEIFQSIDYEHSPQPEENRYHEILENILKSDKESKKDRITSITDFILSKDFIRYAAVFIIFVGISLIYYKNTPLDINEQPQVAHWPILTKEVSKGKKLALSLSDGSKIKLNAESKLIFPEKFTGNNREVFLKGEAYFEIAKNPEKPFVINSGDLVITVLGTSFNVNSYEGNNNVQVAVSSGKVAVRLNEKQWKDNTTFLTKNQVLTFDKKTNSIKSEIKDVTDLIAWKDKTLIFEDATLEIIKKKLERWYDVEIEIKVEEEKQRKFNGRYTNPTLKQVLEGICYSSKLKYTIEGKKVLIIENPQKNE